MEQSVLSKSAHLKSRIPGLIEDLLNVSEQEGLKEAKIMPPLEDLKAGYQGTIQELEQIRGRAMLYPYLGSGRGKKAYVQLLDGSVKMDLLTGVGVQILGHAHKELRRTALKAGLSDILTQGHLLVNPEYLKLSQKLLSLVQKSTRLRHVWISTSGSMAGENALKVVRQRHKGRRKILTFDRAFAGRTTMMSEITGNAKIREGLPAYNEVLRIPFPCANNPQQSVQALRAILQQEGENIATFVFEIILGEGGYKSAPAELFIELFKECKKYDIAIWADEVQTFLRTGAFFAFEKWGLSPYIDILSVGKALQSAATFWTKEYNPRPGLVSGTVSATTPSLAVGLKILEIMEQDYIGDRGRIAQLETEVKKLFKELKQSQLIKDYDVFGLMSAFSLPDSSMPNTLAFLKKLFQKGVIALSCGVKDQARVRFLMPAVIESEDIKILQSVLLSTLPQFSKKAEFTP